MLYVSVFENVNIAEMQLCQLETFYLSKTTSSLCCQDECEYVTVTHSPVSSSQAKGTNSTSFLTRNEVELVPLACEDESSV